MGLEGSFAFSNLATRPPSSLKVSPGLICSKITFVALAQSLLTPAAVTLAQIPEKETRSRVMGSLEDMP